jgi:hypothetical protein
MISQKEISELQGAILKLHGAQSRHLESVPILETFQGQTVWDGIVEVFELPGHPAGMAYAWAHEGDSGGRRYVAVLRAPPVDSPRRAVQAATVAEIRERRGRGG